MSAARTQALSLLSTYYAAHIPAVRVPRLRCAVQPGLRTLTRTCLTPQGAAEAARSNASAPLGSVVAELAKAAGKEDEILGNAAARKEVESWLGKVDTGDKACEDLESLNAHLASRTFIAATPAPTAADIALLAVTYPLLAGATASTHHAYPAAARWASHTSHVLGSAELAPFEPQFEGMPAIVRADLAAEKAKAKAAKAAAKGGDAAAAPAAAAAKTAAASSSSADAAGAAPPAAAAAAGASAPGDKGGKKKDKAAKADKPAKPAKAAPAPAGPPQPSQVDLRVGKIVSIERHPDADSLYLEKVDFGEPEGPRVVLSGLVKYVPIEAMQDRWVVGICNLKPQAMRGIKSHAMLLCATSATGAEGGIEPVAPPEGSEPGDRIWVDGYEGREPDEVLNPKKKIFEAIQPSYCTTDDRSAAWVGPLPDASDGDKAPRVLRTKRGVCKAPTFAGATLS